jgi:hypothetical protein
MRYSIFTLIIALIVLIHGCVQPVKKSATPPKEVFYHDQRVELNLEQANILAELPIACIQNEYPNKLGQTLGSADDLGEPSELHPAFYGCFDWHSSVHGHWSLVKLLKEFPQIGGKDLIKSMLMENISAENILAEVKYLDGEYSKDYERTYGWAWLLKLAEELHTWDDPIGKELVNNLQPLTDTIVKRFIDFLPKLLYPIRVGEHSNTAFALSFAWDYASSVNNDEFKESIKSRAIDYFFTDKDCPLDWEPSGFDFLSPCLEEVDIMRKIMKEGEFLDWISRFKPELLSPDFTLKPGEVSDRSDGKLVHLDGLNFSRAWVLYGLADQYPAVFPHLVKIANDHFSYSFPNLVGDNYEGGHWLGSFAIYAVTK